MKEAYLDDIQIHDALGASPNGFYISEFDGLDFPTLRHVGQDRIGQDGYSPINSLWGPRVVALTGFIDANDVDTYNTRRRAFAELFSNLRDANGSPILSTLKFTTDDNEAYQLEVVLNREPKMPPRNIIGGEFFLPLVAPDPQILSQTLTTTSATTRPTGGGLLLPFTLPATLGASTGGTLIVTNAGTLYTWPVITLRGALTNPWIFNATTGKTWQLNYSMTAADEVVIDMHNQTAILNESSSLFVSVDPNSVWFWLDPGANVINFSTGATADTGTMQMSFRSALLGL